MPASVMTMPEATKAVQMHQQGYSQPQIAAALGRSRTAVRTALRQLDVQPRSPVEGYRAWLALRGGVGNKKQITVSPLELEPPASHRAVDSAHLPPTVRTTRSEQMKTDSLHPAAPQSGVPDGVHSGHAPATAPLAERSAIQCPSCEGTGRVWDMLPRRPSRMQCPTCIGAGGFQQ